MLLATPPPKYPLITCAIIIPVWLFALMAKSCAEDDKMPQTNKNRNVFLLPIKSFSRGKLIFASRNPSPMIDWILILFVYF